MGSLSEKQHRRKVLSFPRCNGEGKTVCREPCWNEDEKISPGRNRVVRRALKSRRSWEKIKEINKVEAELIKGLQWSLCAAERNEEFSAKGNKLDADSQANEDKRKKSQGKSFCSFDACRRSLRNKKRKKKWNKNHKRNKQYREESERECFASTDAIKTSLRWFRFKVVNLMKRNLLFCCCWRFWVDGSKNCCARSDVWEWSFSGVCCGKRKADFRLSFPKA